MERGWRNALQKSTIFNFLFMALMKSIEWKTDRKICIKWNIRGVSKWAASPFRTFHESFCIAFSSSVQMRADRGWTLRGYTDSVIQNNRSNVSLWRVSCSIKNGRSHYACYDKSQNYTEMNLSSEYLKKIHSAMQLTYWIKYSGWHFYLCIQ